MGIIIICVLFVIFLLLWAIIDIVPQSEARVMERLGIFREVWGAGIHLKFPILDKCAVKVDLREQVMELPKVVQSGNSTSWGTNFNENSHSKGIDRIRNSNSGTDTGIDIASDLGFSLSKLGGLTIDSVSVNAKGVANASLKSLLKTVSKKTRYNGNEVRDYSGFENNSRYSDYQGVITKDNVVMHVDAAVFFQITDPKMYAYGMVQPRFALQKLTITTLRNIIGTLNLDETLCSRDMINSKLRATLDEATDNWGMKITRVEIEEILPPPDIQGAMHAQAYAERMRRAIVLEAEGKKEATILEGTGVAERNRLLNENAPNEAIIKMLAIQAMPEVANGQSNTVIIPSELQGFVGLAKGVLEGVKTPTTEN